VGVRQMQGEELVRVLPSPTDAPFTIATTISLAAGRNHGARFRIAAARSVTSVTIFAAGRGDDRGAGHGRRQWEWRRCCRSRSRRRRHRRHMLPPLQESRGGQGVQARAHGRDHVHSARLRIPRRCRGRARVQRGGWLQHGAQQRFPKWQCFPPIREAVSAVGMLHCCKCCRHATLSAASVSLPQSALPAVHLRCARGDTMALPALIESEHSCAVACATCERHTV